MPRWLISPGQLKCFWWKWIFISFSNPVSISKPGKRNEQWNCWEQDHPCFREVAVCPHHAGFHTHLPPSSRHHPCGPALLLRWTNRGWVQEETGGIKQREEIPVVTGWGCRGQNHKKRVFLWAAWLWSAVKDFRQKAWNNLFFLIISVLLFLWLW